MTSTSLRSGVLQGAQRPRVFSPAADVASSAGTEAVELAAMAGLYLDPWQQFVLEHALAERKDGSWAASRVGLVVPRQNGKGSILEARELAGLFLLGERLIIHSAHEFATSLEAFGRLLSLIENVPDFEKRVRRVSRSHGEEGITLKNGSRIRFRTRTKGGGRGFSADCVILDEAMILPESMLAAMLPVLSARPNPQVWYTGSAVDQTVHEHGHVLARIRRNGHEGSNPRLAYFEWSLPYDSPEEVPDDVLADPETWAEVNPGFGLRIAEETVADEHQDLSNRDFAVERCCTGDWPDDDAAASIFDMDKWARLFDPADSPHKAYAFDVSPHRTKGSICFAGEGRVGVVETNKGTGWLVPMLVELAKVAPIFCDERGPASSLIPELEKQGVKVETVNSSVYAQACGLFFDGVEESTLRHTGQQELTAAVRGATTRPLGDRFAWDRKHSQVNITPLVGCTIAHWASETTSRPEPIAVWA